MRCLVLLVCCAACVTPRVSPSSAELSDAGSPIVIPDAGPAPLPDAGPPEAGPSTAGQPITAKRVWTTKLLGVGTSSPRTVDLTGDGILDVVVGGGVQGRSGWVYALDGRTGAQLWKARFPEELYATPTLADVNHDGAPEVFMGGRDFDVTALSGRDGRALWTLRKVNPKAQVPRRNFNGGLVVGDQDGDGVVDLVFSQGGSYDDDKRLPGRLFLVSGATGHIVQNVVLPDGRETYSVPALVSDQPLELLAGSGGETLSGHLWRLKLDDSAKPSWSVESGTQGVIASPFVGQVAGEASAFAAGHDGRVVRVDLGSGEVRWSVENPGYQTRASPSPGRFGGSSTDVVISTSKGLFPNYSQENRVVWLDGRNGHALDTQSTGVFSSASPVVLDFDGDAFDETITLTMDSFTITEGSVVSTLTVFDGAPGKTRRLELKLKGAGAATPALDDLDHDGVIDLVITYFGLVERYELRLEGGPSPRVRWGGFRGPHFNGRDEP